MISAVYINIKKWLQMYGYGVLDYLIQPDHVEELDPRKDINFDEQFNNCRNIRAFPVKSRCRIPILSH